MILINVFMTLVLKLKQDIFYASRKYRQTDIWNDRVALLLKKTMIKKMKF